MQRVFEDFYILLVVNCKSSSTPTYYSTTTVVTLHPHLHMSLGGGEKGGEGEGGIQPRKNMGSSMQKHHISHKGASGNHSPEITCKVEWAIFCRLESYDILGKTPKSKVLVLLVLVLIVVVFRTKLELNLVYLYRQKRDTRQNTPLFARLRLDPSHLFHVLDVVIVVVVQPKHKPDNFFPCMHAHFLLSPFERNR